MALTEAQKVDLRRHLGFGMMGDNPTATDVVYGRNVNPWMEDRMVHLTADEEAFVVDRLSLLNDMEQEYFDSRDNFDTLAAGSFKQNPNEAKQRRSMLVKARKELARFLDAPFYGEGGMRYYH